jgi:hypothetical protein
MAQKFVINSGNLVIGHVELHRELNKDNSTTLGGGYWFYNKVDNTLYLYGSSVDFGKVSENQLREAVTTGILPNRYKELNIKFSTEEFYSDGHKKGWIEIKSATNDNDLVNGDHHHSV